MQPFRIQKLWVTESESFQSHIVLGAILKASRTFPDAIISKHIVGNYIGTHSLIRGAKQRRGLRIRRTKHHCFKNDPGSHLRGSKVSAVFGIGKGVFEDRHGHKAPIIAAEADSRTQQQTHSHREKREREECYRGWVAGGQGCSTKCVSQGLDCFLPSNQTPLFHPLLPSFSL